MFAGCFDKIEWFYDRCKGFINKVYTCLRFLFDLKRFKSAELHLSDFSQGSDFLYRIQYNSYRD